MVQRRVMVQREPVQVMEQAHHPQQGLQHGSLSGDDGGLAAPREEVPRFLQQAGRDGSQLS